MATDGDLGPVSMSIVVLDMVEEWLRAHGYDGLFSSENECVCELADLMSCGFDSHCAACEPGWREECSVEDCDCTGFHIVPEKPEKGGDA